MVKSKMVTALCAMRHPMPDFVTGSIFGNTVDPTDVAALREIANEAIPADVTDLQVYVTGLTVAMLAVVSVCEERGISLTAFHYDRDKGSYFPQPVLTFDRCPFCGAAKPAGAWHCPSCGST